MSSAAIFLVNSGCLNCTMVYWLVGTDILASWVYPVSVLMIGAFFIAYGLKFGLMGIGLMAMVFGAFDVFAKMSALYLAGIATGHFGGPQGTWPSTQDVYFWEQNVLMFGGFALAGFPKLKADRWLLMVVIVLFCSEIFWWPALMQWHGIYSYQVYEAALFIYVYKSAELRRLPAWLDLCR